MFFVILVIPLVMFLFINDKENQATFVAISAVASFLFGLLATYTLKDRHARLANIVKNGSLERGELIFIYEGLSVFSKNDKDRIIEKIDNYVMAELDLEI